MEQVNNCLILNLDSRPDLWENTRLFREKWKKMEKNVYRISGVDYRNKPNVLNELLVSNRIDLNGTGFRNDKTSVLGEFGCFMGHFNCWKYVVDNDLNSSLILEDGITFLREDYENIKINKNIDILFINEEQNNRNMDGNFLGYGTQGYIVTKKGAEKLIKHCFTLAAPIDLQIRHLCNTKIFKADTLMNPYVKRDNNRNSSIAGVQTNQTDLNSKQNTMSIVQRIFINLLQKNVNLDDYL
jgi:GR25 family glycosyltransferase involved in LPS biosynthesis